jgi:hypothetical protein
MSGHAEVLLNAHPSSAIRFSIQPLGGRRRSDSRGPDDSIADDPLALDDHASRVHLFHAAPSDWVEEGRTPECYSNVVFVDNQNGNMVKP